MFVTDRGEVWASTQNGWCWLREEFYGHGWTWESGYDEPLAQVTSLLDLLGGADVSRVVLEALIAVRASINDEIAMRCGVSE
jgi:hypothetical protein